MAALLSRHPCALRGVGAATADRTPRAPGFYRLRKTANLAYRADVAGVSTAVLWE
jgi:hypothetical protein